MNDHIAANRQHWDEAVSSHMGAVSYDVPGFRAGNTRLLPLELAELGDVRGKTLLHMQCHFGLDTLSWAREGATVTGIDFSPVAIETARALATECGIEARFLQSTVYDLPNVLDQQFDIVFTSYGVLRWLPDVPRWARVAAHFVKPGGTFYIAEFHPIAGAFDDAPDVSELRLHYPYFPTVEPKRFVVDGSYAGSKKMEPHAIYEWSHPTSEVLTALIDAGLRIDFLHEFSETSFRFLPFMEPVSDRLFRLSKHHGSVPLVYSIKATKEA